MAFKVINNEIVLDTSDAVVKTLAIGDNINSVNNYTLVLDIDSIAGNVVLKNVSMQDSTIETSVVVPNPLADTNAANKFYVDSQISSAITSLIDSAPGALDTLNELAAALGDDPNFATTITNLITSSNSTTLSTANAYTDATATAINNTISALTTDDIAEGSNLYYTNTRVKTFIDSAGSYTPNPFAVYGTNSYIGTNFTSINDALRQLDASSFAYNTNEINNLTTYVNNTATTLQNNIDAEAATRLANDNTLQSNLNTEISDRITGDSTTLASANSYTDTSVTTSLASAKSYTDNLILTEENARIQGDADTLAAANLFTQNEISTSVSAGALKWETPRTINLAGDATGAATFDGTADFTLTVAVVDDSHNHIISNVDGLQAALDAKQYRTFIQDTAPTGIVDGDLWWDSAEGLLNIRYAGTWVEASPASASLASGSGSNLNADFLDGLDSTYLLSWTNTTNKPTTVAGYGITDAVQEGDSVSLTGAVTGSGVFDSNGNVSIATTATNDPVITLTGAVTGSGTMTNLGNVSIATTATADPTLTLAGDASGSATFTNLGNATLTVTVANDSHTHDTQYYTKAQADSRYVNTTGDTMTGSLVVQGNITATGDVTAFSDRRFKHDIQTLDSALDKVSKMRGTSYVYNQKDSIGVIAQEVEEIVPELVLTNEEGLKSVAYGNMAALFIESIKELKEEITALKAEIKELKNGN